MKADLAISLGVLLALLSGAATAADIPKKSKPAYPIELKAGLSAHPETADAAIDPVTEKAKKPGAAKSAKELSRPPTNAQFKTAKEANLAYLNRRARGRR